MTRLENPIQTLHEALSHAMYEGFPEFHYEDRDHKHYFETKQTRMIPKSRKHGRGDILVQAMFPQTWSSTALGFGGLGGQAITDAYTIVLRSALDGSFCIYFGGRFAYRVVRPNERFMDDIAKNCLVSVMTALDSELYEANENG